MDPIVLDDYETRTRRFLELARQRYTAAEVLLDAEFEPAVGGEISRIMVFRQPAGAVEQSFLIRLDALNREVCREESVSPKASLFALESAAEFFTSGELGPEYDAGVTFRRVEGTAAEPFLAMVGPKAAQFHTDADRHEPSTPRSTYSGELEQTF